MPHAVVIGVNGAHQAPLLFAIDEARRRHATLRVVHCAATRLEQVALYMSDSAYRRRMSAGQTLLDHVRAAVERSDPTIRAEYVLSSRAPIGVLTEESRSAELLVVGIDDIPWWDRSIGRTFAGRLAQSARCPLVVVPENRGGGQRHADVVVALGGTSAARPLLRLAFDLAQDWGCALRAFNVIPAGAEPVVVDGAHATLSEILAGWSETYPEVPVEREVVGGDPSVVCAAATRSAELVLVGGSQRGLRRSVAATVLRHASCPVAIVPIDVASR